MPDLDNNLTYSQLAAVVAMQEVMEEHKIIIQTDPNCGGVYFEIDGKRVEDTWDDSLITATGLRCLITPPGEPLYP